MLKLDSAKLESVGVKSLGHREHILDNIQLIRVIVPAPFMCSD